MKTTIQVSKSKEVACVLLPESKFSDGDDFAPIADEILSLVESQNWRIVVMDFEKVGFLSSTALGRLIQFVSAMRAKGVQVGLFNVQPTVTELFELTHVDQILSVYETRGEAIRGSAAAGQ